MKIHSMAAVFGMCLAPALAAAADEPAAPAAAAPVAAAPAVVEAAVTAPVEPPAGTPPADPAGAAAAPAPTPAPAAVPADTGASEAAPAGGAAPSTVLNVDVEGASAYVWRGENLFGEKQNTQNFSVFPALTATFGGLSLGYWGAFQMSGDNKTTKVDQGVGAETDLIAKYSATLAPNVTAYGMLTYWIYFAADKDKGSPEQTPMYLEPGAGITYSTAADLGLYFGYYRGLQDGTKPYSFLYINPSIGKTLPLTGDISLALGLSAGYKVYTNAVAGVKDYPLDITANIGATIPFADMYVTPGVHASFVTRDDQVVPDASGSDEFIAWAGVHVGYNLGI
jgi:hypothetical protein